MLKRFTKISALLMATTSVITLVPALAADVQKADTVEEGTIYSASCKGPGTYVVDGEMNGEDEAIYYVKDGKFTKLEDAQTGDKIGDIVKDKYLELNDGDYYVDITTGKKIGEDIIGNLNDDTALALKKQIKKDNSGWLSKDNYENGSMVNPDQIHGNKKLDINKWRQFEYKLDDVININGVPSGNYRKEKETIYYNEDGTYIDADYNLGRLGVNSTTYGAVTIENTKDTYESTVSGTTYEIKAQINNKEFIDDGGDYLIRTAKLSIFARVKNSGNEYKNVTEDVEFGSKNNNHKQTLIDNSGKIDASVTVMQTLSKVQSFDTVDGIKHPKTVNTYFFTSDDGTPAHIFGLGDVSELGLSNPRGPALITGSPTGLASHYFDMVDNKYYAQNIKFKSKNGYYYTDIGDHDDTDADAWGIGGGNLFCIGNGYIKEWINKDSKFEKIYKVDGGLNNFSAAFGGSLVAWNQDDKIYSVITPKGSNEEKAVTTENKADAGKSETVTAAKIGWIKASDGAWTYAKADGTKAIGWLQDGVNWFYLNSSGIMQTGWINDNGTWYYCNELGAMLYNATVDGYVLGSNGAWIK
ncbi:hypothetical protein [Clostridium sp. YIM B02555]|uniref:N-acetylmuramoyl-L-alanine amidase family protein n=1 Tax=Clostridium sp. YIM B02555 TaxID=2911968 RepID=UPI001EEDAE8F|nr:hypothetical protein [Clostridium sp. YIM B02555]